MRARNPHARRTPAQIIENQRYMMRQLAATPNLRGLFTYKLRDPQAKIGQVGATMLSVSRALKRRFFLDIRYTTTEKGLIIKGLRRQDEMIEEAEEEITVAAAGQLLANRRRSANRGRPRNYNSSSERGYLRRHNALHRVDRIWSVRDANAEADEATAAAVLDPDNGTARHRSYVARLRRDFVARARCLFRIPKNSLTAGELAYALDIACTSLESFVEANTSVGFTIQVSFSEGLVRFRNGLDSNDAENWPTPDPQADNSDDPFTIANYRVTRPNVDAENRVTLHRNRI